LGDYISSSRGLEIVRKIGDWIIIRSRDNNNIFYIASNMFSSIYMTKEEYENMIVINNSTLLLNETEGNYYIVYYGVRNKTYYTERTRSYKTGIELTVDESSGYLICNDSEAENYINIYNKKEVAIVFKESGLINSIFNQFRKKPLKKLTVPSDIVSAIGGIIYYKENNNNKLSYI
jgi:sporulation protein YlmC with PRC-barrel domain